MNQVARGADVKLEKLSKAYGHIQVLQNLNLELFPGEFVTVVGRSGCGKSTLLRQIAGLELPSLGKILIDDQPLLKLNRISPSDSIFPTSIVETGTRKCWARITG